MKIVLASNNQGKLAELQAMLAPLQVALVRQADLNIPEAEEPYRTFVENALTKRAMPPSCRVCLPWLTMPDCAWMPLAVSRAWTRPTTPPVSATQKAMTTT